MKRWQLTGREYWLWLALWIVGTVLASHWLVSRNNDLRFLIVSIAAALIAYVIVIIARLIPAWRKHRV